MKALAYFEEGYIFGSTFRGKNYALHTMENGIKKNRVFKNRRKLAQTLGFEAPILTLKQIHSREVIVADENNLAEFQKNPLREGDGIITNLPDILIGILTADCMPLLFFEPSGTFAAVHAGWRGVEAGIHLKTLELFQDRFEVDPKSITLWVGPHIRSCCFETGLEVLEKFQSHDLKSDFYRRKDDKAFLSLEEILTEELSRNGMKEENILRSEYCSKCEKHPRFYSFRKGDTEKRILSFIGRPSSDQLPFSDM